MGLLEEVVEAVDLLLVIALKVLLEEEAEILLMEEEVVEGEDLLHKKM